MIYSTGEQIGDPVEVPGVEASPLVVWVTIGTVLLVLVTKAAASAAPNITEALSRWKSYRQQSEDARIGDLSGQVDHLAGRVWSLEQRQQRQDRYLYAHAEWDRQVLALAIERGLDLQDLGVPPPLWPPPE